jgi:hypothetical protein
MCYNDSMKKYIYLEDYLEVIAGKRDRDLNSHNNWFSVPKPLVSLARYDVSFIDSVTSATLSQVPLTDRQAELALKIVSKYRRQLNTHGIDVDPDNPPKLRLPMRHVDRSSICSIEGEHMVLRFPYSNTLIQEIREFQKESQGAVRFDKPRKVWLVDITEYNVNFMTAWAPTRGISVDPEILHLQAAILEEESRDWAIRLRRDDTGQLVLDNAPDSLMDYLRSQGITLEQSNLIPLLDSASVLGYTATEELWTEAEALVGASIMPFLWQRTYDMVGDVDQLPRIREYARLVNRMPVLVYDPMPNSMVSTYKEVWGDVTVVGNSKTTEVHGDVIISHRPFSDREDISLLISHSGIMAGMDRQVMLQNSQKIIYFTRKLK